jgi:hypothetical protein
MPFDKRMRLYPIKPFQTAVSPASCSAAVGPLKYSSITAFTGFAEERIWRVTTFSTGDEPFPVGCLFGKIMFTLITSDVDVGKGVKVFVDVDVGVNVAVLVGVDEKVAVAVFVGVKVDVFDGVKDGVIVIVADGIKLGVLLGLMVGVREGVAVIVAVDVIVEVFDAVTVIVGVNDGVEVAVIVGVSVMVGLGVYDASRQTGAESIFPKGAKVSPNSSWIFTYFTYGNCLTVAVKGRAILYAVPLD